MSVLFLDIDGVLNSAIWRCGLPDDYDGVQISSVLMFNLNTVIVETGCDIVVSSDWRRGCKVSDLNDTLRNAGLRKDITDITPFIDRKNAVTSQPYASNFMKLEEERAIEITHWLKDNPTDVWVAVDDMDLTKGDIPASNFVHTTYTLGLTDDLAAQAIRKLSL